jgi:hypothetical protein
LASWHPCKKERNIKYVYIWTIEEKMVWLVGWLHTNTNQDVKRRDTQRLLFQVKSCVSFSVVKPTAVNAFNVVANGDPISHLQSLK